MPAKTPLPPSLVRRIDSACQDILEVLANGEDPRVTGRRPDPDGLVTLTRSDLATVRRAVRRLQNTIKRKAPQ